MIVTCALGPDCAGTLITHFLDRARHDLDCAVYEVGPAYRWAFAGAAERGVRVRLLLDGHDRDGNGATAQAVSRSGGRCRMLPRRSGVGHWKLLRADHDRLAVGTGNLIWRDAPRDARGRLPPECAKLPGTREWWVFLAGARRTVGIAREHFERAWRSAAVPERAAFADLPAPPGSVGLPPDAVPPLRVRVADRRVALVVGGAAVAGHLAAAMATARRRVLVTAPYVSTGDPTVRVLIERITAAQARGVDVRLLLGARPQARDARVLADRGVPVAVMDPLRCTRGHAKGAVVDDVAMIGSANWSAAGLGANWEAVLAVGDGDVAGYFADSLLSDWALAAPVAPAAGRVTVLRRALPGMLGVA